MDAVEFLKTSYRMCNTYEDCNACPVDTYACYIHGGNCRENPDDVVAVVEQWAKDHSGKTRQSEFLKLFPNAQMSVDCDVIWMCPKYIDETYCPKGDCHNIGCRDCKRKFWLTEVPDND